MKKSVHIPKQLFGIIGYPLGHSLSPLLHNWGFQNNAIEAAYTAWPMPESDVAQFMDALKIMKIQGLSVTIPHKQTVMEHCDKLTKAAQDIGAVNTLYWKNGKLWGGNTDIVGFLAPLKKMSLGDTIKPKTALILGAGGAARAVVAGLKELGIPYIYIANRTYSRAEALAQDFMGSNEIGAEAEMGVEGAGDNAPNIIAIPWEDRAQYMGEIIVNTTPCGMSSSNSDIADASPLSVADFEAARTVLEKDAQERPFLLAYDLVYSPLVTPFMQCAVKAGWQSQDGLDMFVAQGCEQFRLWTGHDLVAHDARTLLLEALS
ncbi:MAG: shikimate dehydrogenase [Pseudomonadota bacterium]